MPRLTFKEKLRRIECSYNKQYNEIFKLHKFLVECEVSSHDIQKGNPIDDAITLLTKLIGDKKWAH